MGGLAALAVVVVAYTVVASKLDRWWITGAMVFVATGVILGPGGLDVLPFSVANETVLAITELTLALLLFSDASTVRLREVEGDVGLPRRLLFVGLPLTVIGGALVAHLMFPEVGWASAALVATVLAPTDAALGLAVVTNKAVPARIRRALNVESGLNDGIATPLVTLCIAAVAAEEELGETAWGLEAVKQIGLALAAAVVVGYLGGKLLAVAAERGWTSGGVRAAGHLGAGGAGLPGRGHGRWERLHRRVRRGDLVRGRDPPAPGRACPVHRDPRLGGFVCGVVDLRGAVRWRGAHPRPRRSTHHLRHLEFDGDQDGAGRGRANWNVVCVGRRWPSWAGSARVGWPRLSSPSLPWRRSSTAATGRCCWQTVTWTILLFGGAAWHLGVAAGCPVRGVDCPGGHHPGDHAGS